MIHGVDEKHNLYVAPELRPQSSHLGLYTWTMKDLKGTFGSNLKMHNEKCGFFFSKEGRVERSVFFQSHLQTICTIVLFIIHVHPISWMWIWQNIKATDGRRQAGLIRRSLLVRRFGRQRMIYSQVESCGEQRAGARTGSTGGDHRNNKGIRTTIERSNSSLFQPSTAQQIF